ncbi:MAG: hypothetical protein BWY76_03233 [bacterium ADurb.Bin429]|nr:MAG: hypothetical protein BWY76_03233 [bacterium ADurb.Bin429]
MLTISTRSMTPDERAVVERWIAAANQSSPIRWILFWVLGVPALAVGVAIIARLVRIALTTVFEPTRIPDVATLGWDMYLGAGLVVLWAILFILARRARRPRAGSMYRQALTTALEQDTVETLDCTVADAVVIEGDGARQPALFALDVGDGKLLVLQGLDVLELVMAGRFPNSAFTLVRLPDRDEIIAVEARGEYLKPSRTRKPLAQDECFPGACAVLDGTLAELDALLKPAATAAAPLR